MLETQVKNLIKSIDALVLSNITLANSLGGTGDTVVPVPKVPRIPQTPAEEQKTSGVPYDPATAEPVVAPSRVEMLDAAYPHAKAGEPVAPPPQVTPGPPMDPTPETPPPEDIDVMKAALGLQERIMRIERDNGPGIGMKYISMAGVSSFSEMSLEQVAWAMGDLDREYPGGAA